MAITFSGVVNIIFFYRFKIYYYPPKIKLQLNYFLNDEYISWSKACVGARYIPIFFKCSFINISIHLLFPLPVGDSINIF